MSAELKQCILDTLDDLATGFLYYDRKEDDDLPVGAIQKAVIDGVITQEEIVTHFAEILSDSVAAEQPQQGGDE